MAQLKKANERMIIDFKFVLNLDTSLLYHIRADDMLRLFIDNHLGVRILQFFKLFYYLSLKISGLIFMFKTSISSDEIFELIIC